MTNLGDFWGTLEVVLEWVYVVMIVYYIIEEIIEIRIHRLKYFKNFWNILDIVIIIMSLARGWLQQNQSKKKRI